MQLSKIREGDEIQCNIKGRVFNAVVEEKLPGEGIRIKPVDPRYTYFHVTARQVTKIVRREPK